MPIDPYTVLHALVRAEAARDAHARRKPADPERKAEPEHHKERQPEERHHG